jgi:hypothetical protein
MKTKSFLFLLTVLLLPFLFSSLRTEAQQFKAVNDTIDLYPGIPKTFNLLANDTIPTDDSIKIIGGIPAGNLITGTNVYKGFFNYLVIPKWGFNGNVSGGYSIINYTLGKISSANILFRIHDHSYDSLDINNVKAEINASGNEFSSFATLETLFRIPKDGQQGTFYNFDLWIGGKGSDSSLYLAADKFRQGPNNSIPGTRPDFYAGPVMDSVNYSIDQDTLWNRVWKVKKSEVEYHKNHWNEQGYIPPSNILNWPGNGNTTSGQAPELAPYHDNNGDGKYNAADGDYPDIMGDEAIFTIYNDDRDIHKESGGKKLGVEIHAMAYAFNLPDDSAFKNTIFFNYKIFNRSSRSYYNTYLGVYADLDIGYIMDDYIGCDVKKSSFIGYNGLPVDGTGQPFAYGAHPPAQSVTILGGPFMDLVGQDRPKFDNAGHQLCNESINGTGFGDTIANNERYGLTNFMPFYNGDGNGPPLYMSDPSTANDYYHLMHSVWIDSTHLTYGGQGHSGFGSYGPDCRFMFPGKTDSLNWGAGCQAPNGSVNWTMKTASIAPNDIFGIGGMGPFTFHPGDVQQVDVALVFARDYTGQDTTQGPSVTKLDRMIDIVRNSYNTGKLPNGDPFFGIQNQAPLSSNTLKIYPNPTTNEVTIELSPTSSQGTLSLLNINGQEVMKCTVRIKTQIDISNLPGGVYFVRVTNDKTVLTGKLIKQ